MQFDSNEGKTYILVRVDDYSRYTYVEFVRERYDTLFVFETHCLCLQYETGEEIDNIILIQSNHEIEIEKSNFSSFCNTEGIAHKFSAHITPRHNGIVERKI